MSFILLVGSIIILLTAIMGLLYWLIVATEGVFLGPRLVVWLYDITAHHYQAIKAFNREDEEFFIARPLLAGLTGQPAPLILDVATGSGRLPLALLATPSFAGRVTGLDAAGNMLAQAAGQLRAYSRRVSLVQQTAVPLPFAANCFDAVTCLEALEFFPSDEAALREMARVLRPGGFLMISRRAGWEGKLFLRRYRSRAAMTALLGRLGFTGVQIHLWQEAYDLVTAVKAPSFRKLPPSCI